MTVFTFPPLLVPISDWRDYRLATSLSLIQYATGVTITPKYYEIGFSEERRLVQLPFTTAISSARSADD